MILSVMDPLSVSTGVLSLVEVTRKTLKAIDDLGQDSGLAPRDITSLARSLQSLMGILDSLVHYDTADSGCKHAPSFQALDFISA